ncbi:MAG: OmpA family protein [Roseobacter sp.]
MTGRGWLSCACALWALLWAPPVTALELELPVGARLTAERATQLDGFDAPIGVFDGETVPSVYLEGAITQRAWRVATPGLTPLQVMIPLRDQLNALGYRLAFECASQDCGGFDFRFNTQVLPGPNMYVNISRFRYLTALRGAEDTPAQAVAVLVSVTEASAYVQVIVADTGVDVDDMLPEREIAPLVPEATLLDAVSVAVDVKTATLLEQGFVILSDLNFATGTSELRAGQYRSLSQLAAVLQERSDLRLALVGHTDAVGGLEPNIALSRARARSVRDRLITQYGVAADRLDAEGMGYLSPVASNLTPEGRDQNRRVEAVLLNVE